MDWYLSLTSAVLNHKEVKVHVLTTTAMSAAVKVGAERSANKQTRVMHHTNSSVLHMNPLTQTLHTAALQHAATFLQQKNQTRKVHQTRDAVFLSCSTARNQHQRTASDLSVTSHLRQTLQARSCTLWGY